MKEQGCFMRARPKLLQRQELSKETYISDWCILILQFKGWLCLRQTVYIWIYPSETKQHAKVVGSRGTTEE